MLRGDMVDGDRRFAVSEIQAYGLGGANASSSDNVLPKISLFGLFDGGSISWSSDVKVFATYSDNIGVDPNSVRLSVDGVNVTSGVSASPYSLWFRSDLSPGSHIIELALSDLGGNVASESLSFTVIPLMELGIGISAIIVIVGFLFVVAKSRKHKPG